MNAYDLLTTWKGPYLFEQYLERVGLEQVLEQGWQFGPWPTWKTDPNGGYGYSDYLE